MLVSEPRARGFALRIASEEEHRALAYVGAVRQQGYALSKREFEAYVSTPRGQFWALRQAFSRSASYPSEPLLERLKRMLWLSSSDDGLHLTDLGAAVLQAMERADLESEVPTEVVLSADDPFAYAKVVAKLGLQESPMLVDPYFRLAQFADIVYYTTVSRLLVGPKADVPGLKLAIRDLPPDRTLDIRQADAVHDRFSIPSSGSIEMLGTSLNGVGKKTTVLVPIEPPIADQIREAHETLWAEATPVMEDAAPGV